MSQQKPSTQFDDAQSVLAVHAVPFAARAQTVPSQCAPVAQSVSAAHAVLQAAVLVSHANGTQLVVAGVQSPVAPQVAAAAVVSTSAHFAAAQAFPSVGT